MINTYIVSWQATTNGWATRGGYTVIAAHDKRAARRRLRGEIFLHRGERLKITEVRQLSPVQSSGT